ncbi:membrane integrity-associated transporter subunit PqiC [bacterium]|nr:membrane integrity-associated transporter subunit PqiC [bacterium]
MKTLLKISLCFLFLTLIQCSTPKSLAKNYYLFDYTPQINESLKVKKPFSYKVRVQKFKIQPIYDKDNKIVFRTSQYQLRYYSKELWVARPNILITDVVENQIASYSLFEEFRKDFIDSPDFELAGSIDAIEKYDTGNFGGAHLAMTLKLIDSNSQAVIEQHKFDVIEELFNSESSALVRQLSLILEKQTEIFIKKIKTHLETLEKTKKEKENAK